jgi:methionyl-tRNA formyltransferase
VVFAGTPAAAVPSLRALLDSPRHEVLAVLTRPPAPAGRGRRTTQSPVAELAAQAALPVLSPRRRSEPEFLEQLTALAPDCCPVVAYGALIPPPVLGIPPHGWVNLHFSLLPAWRGAAPVQHALLHGDEVTGASTFRLEAGLDTGPVFGVVTEPVRPTDTAGELLERLSHSGAQLLLATLDGIEDGTVLPVPQSADGVSFAPKLTVEDVRIDWTAPGRHVERLVRAATPNPGAWTTFRDERLKIAPIRLRGANDLAPGEVRADKSGVAVGTGTLAVELGEVQPPGKRLMAAADWARGARIADGERLG